MRHPAAGSSQSNGHMKRLSVVVLVIVPLVSFAQPLPEGAYRAILTAQDFRDVSALDPVP